MPRPMPIPAPIFIPGLDEVFSGIELEVRRCWDNGVIIDSEAPLGHPVLEDEREFVVNVGFLLAFSEADGKLFVSEGLAWVLSVPQEDRGVAVAVGDGQTPFG